MKSKVVKIGVSSILFFSMILAALALVRPAIRGFSQQLETYGKDFLAMVESKTGLQVSYDSLSPAILSVFRIKGIVVSDGETKIPVLSIRKATLSYNLFRLLTGDIQGAFSKLTISGITLEYDAVKSSRVVEKIMALLSTEEEVLEKQEITSSEGETPKGKVPASISLPFAVDIQDVNLHYRDDLVDVLVAFRNIMVLDTASQGFLSAQGNGISRITLQDAALASMPQDVQESIKDISVLFSFDASILPQLDGSTADITFASVSSSAFSLARTSLFGEYNQGVVKVTSMQGNLPIWLMAEMNLDEGQVHVLAQMEEFDPSSYFRIKTELPLVDKVRGTLISGKYEFQLDTKSMDFDYEGKGGLFLPESLLAVELLPGGLALDYDFSGNATDVTIRDFRVSNTNLDFSLEGAVNIPNLQASGFAFLERFTVPGSGDISAELYIDALDRGFTCFIPQLYYGERSFTALQLTMIPEEDAKSLDFEFEASDYSHIDFGVPGVVRLSGSILNEDKPYVQANLGINDFFLDSAVNVASFFVSQDQRGELEALAAKLSSYVTTNELYLATNLSSISYNVDYWILADANNDDNLLIFSFTGNETTINLSQFDLLLAGQDIQLTAGLDFDEDYTQALFNADISVNAVPYSIAGSYTFGSWLNLSGSYGLLASLSFDGKENLLEGQLQMQELPVSVGDAMILCSLETSGFIPRNDMAGFRVDVTKLTLSEISNLMFTNPELSLSGQISNYGFLLENFLFHDEVSTLDGSGGIMWNFSQGIINTAGLDLHLANAFSSELYTISMSFSNPEQKDFSQLNFLNDVYFSAQIDVNNLPMARFRPMQNQGNVVTAAITAMGTFENPYLSVNIAPSSVSFGGVPYMVTANARLEDGEIFLDEGEVQLGNQHIRNIFANFSLADFSGYLHAEYDSNLGDVYSINIPLDVNVTSSLSDDSSETIIVNPDGTESILREDNGFVGVVTTLARGLPEMISVDAKAELGGTFFAKPETVELNLVRVPGFIMVNSQNDLGISGSITEDGFINMNLSGRMPLHAVVQGSVKDEALDIQLRNISSDLSKFKGLVSFPYIMLHGGYLSGDLHIGGILADPQFEGQLLASNLIINCPDYVPELMIAPRAPITFQDNELLLNKVHFNIADGSATLDLRLVMDRWMIDILTLGINTPPNVMVPARVNIPASVPGAPSILIEGNSTCNLDIDVTMNSIEVVGRFFVDNVDINIVSGGLRGQTTRQEGLVYTQSSSSDYVTILDIGITTGQHVELIFDPVLRGLIAPNTKGVFRYDSSSDSYSIDSDIVLRGGEITYLNRNFYLREGRVIFTENDSLDPIITVRAEIREHDQNGEPVRISLSAENQRLSAFSPTYSSSPPKSEIELMTILGQALTADAQSGLDVLLSGVDYGFNLLVLRKIENALRDFLNFDIFSLRTMGLQNSLKQWFSNNGEKKKLTIGNFFDNTTVYIGKYFGSSIYADAMLHFTYDENKVLEDASSSGLRFQPEIGLEMDSPFGAIRWSMAPDLESAQHLWVPSTSISLSWKFSL